MKGTIKKVEDINIRLNNAKKNPKIRPYKELKERKGEKSIEYIRCKACNHHKSFKNNRLLSTYDLKCCKCGNKI